MVAVRAVAVCVAAVRQVQVVAVPAAGRAVAVAVVALLAAVGPAAVGARAATRIVTVAAAVEVLVRRGLAREPEASTQPSWQLVPRARLHLHVPLDVVALQESVAGRAVELEASAVAPEQAPRVV